MSNLTLSLNGISQLPPVRAAGRWIQRHQSACALGILAGITIAGLAAYRYSTQNVPQQANVIHAVPSTSLTPSPIPSMALATVAPPNPSPIFEAATSPSPSVATFLESMHTCSQVQTPQHSPEQLVVHKLCTDPYQFYSEIQTFDDMSQMGYLKLFELCPCPKLSNAARLQLENHAMELLTRTCPKDSPLTVVSIGPGGCYQELVYLAKLANAGYQQINLVLIDLEDLSDKKSFLQLFCAQCIPGCNVNIVNFNDLETYKELAKKHKYVKTKFIGDARFNR